MYNKIQTKQMPKGPIKAINLRLIITQQITELSDTMLLVSYHLNCSYILPLEINGLLNFEYREDSWTRHIWEGTSRYAYVNWGESSNQNIGKRQNS